MLKFSQANMKLAHLADHMGLKKSELVSFDLPAGWTCPKANICKCLANRDNGKIKKIGHILCYASKAEGYSPSCRRLRWHNFDQLSPISGDAGAMCDLIEESLPIKAKVIRIHSSGDFFNASYFEAWKLFAIKHPEIVVFGYTKILDYAIAYKPDNFCLQFSYGSMDDTRRDTEYPNTPTCYIAEYDNQYPNIPVICGNLDESYQDYDAIFAGRSFVLSIH